MKREVEFRSENPDEMIRADLYTPDEGEGPWPVVVMGGGWCYVKELIMPEYARYFLPEGVAALIFDYRHLGASDGGPWTGASSASSRRSQSSKAGITRCGRMVRSASVN